MRRFSIFCPVKTPCKNKQVWYNTALSRESGKDIKRLEKTK